MEYIIEKFHNSDFADKISDYQRTYIMAGEKMVDHALDINSQFLGYGSLRLVRPTR